MRKKLGVLGIVGLLAALCSFYMGGDVHGQANQAGGVARTRIAILNLQEVMKSYNKFTAVRDELKRRAEKHETVLKNKIARGQELETQHKDPKTTKDQKKELENQMRTLRAEMENIKAEAREELAEYERQQLAQIYQEVDAVVREYAASNEIDLVLRYSEDWSKPEEYWNPPAVVGRLSAPFWPMYYQKDMEITSAVSELLNRKVANRDSGGSIRQTGFKGKK